MSELSGAFLFSDIEGSTRLLLRLGPRYPEVLNHHNRILDETVHAAGGRVVDREGDGMFAVFASPAEALAAALGAQRAFAAEPWPEGASVRVRMGIHAGGALVTETGYTGLDVHRAARIASAGHGGQILLSDPARGLVEASLPAEMRLRDLGSHQLKDLPSPERIFQAEAPDLAVEFPPLRALDIRPHNLPSELTEFVGRERERESIRALLERSRLVTLLGPGGTGKTRLALRVAADLLSEFGHGVYFIPLEAVQERAALPLAIARHLGMEREAGSLDLLANHLRDRELLLLLDNFEQLVAAAPVVRHLLEAAPRLRILVTSRILLNIRGEQVFNVPALSVPHGADLSSAEAIESLARIDGVALLVRRIQAVNPQFTLSASTAPAVAQIVARVEGMPLAIELAAARTRLLSVDELAAELGDALAVLKAGASDVPDRHRTMRNAIAWSHDLLDDGQRAAFRRLSVFLGGFSLQAAARILAGGPVDDVEAAVASLLDQSLLRSQPSHGQSRFGMLETVRTFANEQLVGAAEADEIHRRHADFFLELVEQAERHLTGQDQLGWIERLAGDRDNLQAVLAYALERGETDLGLRLAGASWRFWQAVGAASEIRNVLAELLTRSDTSDQPRAKGLAGLAGLAYWQADYDEAAARYKEALRIYEAAGDRFNVADVLFGLSVTATWQGDHRRGAELADAALQRFRELEAHREVGMVLMARGFAAWMQGDLAAARPLWEESLAVAEQLGDRFEEGTKRLAIASLAYQQGDRRGALAIARGAYAELVRLGNMSGIVMALDWLAALAASLDPEGAVRVSGAAARLRERIGGGMRPQEVGLPGAREQAADLLPEEAIERAWQEGAALTIEAAVSSGASLAARSER